MRWSIGFAVVMFSLGSSGAFGEPGDSPKATLAGWTQHMGDWNIDQLLKIYSVHGDKEASFARALADLALAEGKLQKVVRNQWGQKAELAVARAIVADTLEDDLAADEKIDGEHATVTLKAETRLPPLLLVKVNGQWKIDIAAYMRGIGDDEAPAVQLLGQTTAVVQAAMDGLKSGRFKDNDAVVDYLKLKYDQLASPSLKTGVAGGLTRRSSRDTASKLTGYTRKVPSALLPPITSQLFSIETRTALGFPGRRSRRGGHSPGRGSRSWRWPIVSARPEARIASPRNMPKLFRLPRANAGVFRGVAQLGRALGSGPRGRRFKSCHPDDRTTRCPTRGFLLGRGAGFALR